MANLRSRAVALLTSYFSSGDVCERPAVFHLALGDLPVHLKSQIDFTGAAAVFADHVVDKLLAFGRAPGGYRHCLAVLLATMAEARGRQTDPEFTDLQKELNAECRDEAAYLKRLIADEKRKAELYSPLHGKAVQTGGAKGKRPHGNSSRKARKMEAATPARDYDDILAAFAQVPRAALLGAPGSGKSTTLRKLAVDLAQRALQDGDGKAPIPLLAFLGNWRGGEPLTQFLAESATPEIGCALEMLSRAGRLVVLLDGLNEMPTATRAAKAAEVRELLTKTLHASTPVFVSCRREDYVDELDLRLDTLTLEPLTPPRIRAAVRQWITNRGEPVETAERFFWQLAGDERLAQVFDGWQAAGGGEEFWSEALDLHCWPRRVAGYDLWKRHIGDPRCLLRLAANPFLLDKIFRVWDLEKRLPATRADLLHGLVLCLLGREGLLVVGTDTLNERGALLVARLSALAVQMRRSRVYADNENFDVLTAVRRSVASRVLGKKLLKKALDSTLLEAAAKVRFRHRSLQEYFAARMLNTQLSSMDASALWPADLWWHRNGWEETAVLLAGFEADDGTAVIHWLGRAQPEVAAQCINESGAEYADRAALLRELQAAWLPRLTGLHRDHQPEARAAVGRALVRLGLDARKGVGLRSDGIPDIEWVAIPGGDFLYQDGERREASPFQMARYPVTNAQFQAFLNANDGYHDDRWWIELSDPPRTPEPSQWSEANCPRETLSWCEAMAFCSWLSEKLGAEVRLPAEWEWERAARGTSGAMYPWGDGYVAGSANVSEAWEAGFHNLARTSAVGIYPEGSSAEGVLDLCGNLWEWCLNEYENPNRMQRSGKGSRVLRGGSWVHPPESARADYRVHYHPHFRGHFIGFRVVSG